MSSIQSKITRYAKKKENMTDFEEINQAIEIDTEIR